MQLPIYPPVAFRPLIKAPARFGRRWQLPRDKSQSNALDSFLRLSFPTTLIGRTRWPTLVGAGFLPNPRRHFQGLFTLLASSPSSQPTNRYFRFERSWDFPFQSFAPVTVLPPSRMTWLSCRFRWPASKLCPQSRAVPHQNCCYTTLEAATLVGFHL